MSSDLTKLTISLSANVERVVKHMHLNNIPEPPFHVDGPQELHLQDEEIEAARISAIETSTEIQDLLLGPTMLLRPIVSPAKQGQNPL